MRFLFLFIVLLFGEISFAQETSKVKLTDYIREIQIWEKEENHMTLSFWIPKSYWKIALEENPQVPKETVDQLISTFENYIFVCGLDLEINLDATMSFTDEATLRNSMSIEDSDGNIYLPLTNEQISVDAQQMAEAMKPMFAKMLGQMGEGMHFYFFEVKDEQNNDIIDEYQEGNFTIKHSNREFAYSLPLVTLMPAKKCPVDNAEMKGNWIYCPFHGKSL